MEATSRRTGRAPLSMVPAAASRRSVWAGFLRGRRSDYGSQLQWFLQPESEGLTIPCPLHGDVYPSLTDLTSLLQTNSLNLTTNTKGENRRQCKNFYSKLTPNVSIEVFWQEKSFSWGLNLLGVRTWYKKISGENGTR